MPFLDDLDDLLKRERERQSSDERQKATDERFDRLEAGLGTLAEAIGKLGQNPPERSSSGGDGEDSDDSDGGRTAGGSSGSDADDDDDGGPELPLERVSKMDVPRIWQGDDEPSTVKYLDADDGSEKTRKGRKKGQPYGWNVEAVEDSGGDEAAA